MEKIINKLKNYFDCEVIGSYLFVKEGYLQLDEINDIDIMVRGKDMLFKVIQFLNDEGFEESESPRRTHIDKYGNFNMGSLIFKSKDFPLPIDIVVTDMKIEVKPLGDIIAMKWNSRSESDIKQLKIILDRTEISNTDKS